MLGRLGGYEVSGVVGAGGMGVVLKAVDKSLDRTVAIKVLAPHLATSGAARKRFAREAKAAAAVLHPNVIAIHSVSNDENAAVSGDAVRARRRRCKSGSTRKARFRSLRVLRIGRSSPPDSPPRTPGARASRHQAGQHPAGKGTERVTMTDFGLARAVDDATITQAASSPARRSTCRPSRPAASRSTSAATCSASAASCTRCAPAGAVPRRNHLRRVAAHHRDQPRPIREINPEIPEWLCGIIATADGQATGRSNSVGWRSGGAFGTVPGARATADSCAVAWQPAVADHLGGRISRTARAAVWRQPGAMPAG